MPQCAYTGLPLDYFEDWCHLLPRPRRPLPARSPPSPPLPQVVYPALDLKVKNVTRAYSVEHEDEASLGGRCRSKAPANIFYFLMNLTLIPLSSCRSTS